MKMAREQPASGDPKAPEDITGPPAMKFQSAWK